MGNQNGGFGKQLMSTSRTRITQTLGGLSSVNHNRLKLRLTIDRKFKDSIRNSKHVAPVASSACSSSSSSSSSSQLTPPTPLPVAKVPSSPSSDIPDSPASLTMYDDVHHCLTTSSSCSPSSSPPTYTSTSSSNSSSSTSSSMLHSVSMANGGSTLLSLGSFSVKSEPVLTTLTPEPDAESEMDESMPHFGLHSMVFSQQQPAHPRLVKDTQSAA